MTYLQYKWREYFMYLDANKDGVLDTTDGYLDTENYFRFYNLTEREVYVCHLSSFVRAKIHRFHYHYFSIIRKETSTKMYTPFKIGFN